MQDVTDMELLRDYLRQGSEEAFAGLVRRHVGLVYSAALRRVGNAGQAEEITQAVFIILARKAAGLRVETVLEGWLYETTRLTALSFLRRERRRQSREQEAYMQGTAAESNDPEVWNQLAPLLDDAMAQLGKKDRDAVVLRFFKEKNLREVAVALKVSEAAAQSRVHRAVEKLRKFFTKRGVVLSAAVLTAAISANAAQAAPVAVANSVVAAAVAKGAAASSSTLTLIKGALKFMAWTKMKIAVVVVGVGVLLAAGTTTTVVRKLQSSALDRYLQDPDLGVITNDLPPMVAIQRTHFPWKDPRMLMGRTLAVSAKDGTLYQKQIGRCTSLRGAILDAYGPSFLRTNELPNSVRMIYPDELAHIMVDYLVTTPDHPAEKFQDEIRRKFGWTAHVEMRDVDVLFIKLDHTNAPGMKPTDGLSEEQWEAKLPQDKVFFRHGETVASFAEGVQWMFPQPLIDETGLTRKYDFVLREFDQDQAKQVILDNLGLELVPGHVPMKMLVVEKAR